MNEYNKKEFVKDVIKALEDAERSKIINPKSNVALAREAFAKLQFDYPVRCVFDA